MAVVIRLEKIDQLINNRDCHMMFQTSILLGDSKVEGTKNLSRTSIFVSRGMQKVLKKWYWPPWHRTTTWPVLLPNSQLLDLIINSLVLVLGVYSIFKHL